MQYKQIFRHFRWGRSAAVAIIIMVVVIPLATYLLVLQFVWVWNDLLVPMAFLCGVGRGQRVFPGGAATGAGVYSRCRTEVPRRARGRGHGRHRSAGAA